MGTEGDDEDRETEIEDHPGPKGTANWQFDQDKRVRERVAVVTPKFPGRAKELSLGD